MTGKCRATPCRALAACCLVLQSMAVKNPWSLPKTSQSCKGDAVRMRAVKCKEACAACSAVPSRISLSSLTVCGVSVTRIVVSSSFVSSCCPCCWEPSSLEEDVVEAFFTVPVAGSWEEEAVVDVTISAADASASTVLGVSSGAFRFRFRAALFASPDRVRFIIIRNKLCSALLALFASPSSTTWRLLLDFASFQDQTTSLHWYCSD
jgi:hypothetical protein